MTAPNETTSSGHPLDTQRPPVRDASRSLGTPVGTAAHTSIAQLVSELVANHPQRIVARLTRAPVAGEYSDFPGALDPRILRALGNRGIHELYSHQRLAWNHVVDDGADTVIVTPTASGKSLCFHLPALQAATRPSAQAGKSLYLFPTKALAQDQMHELVHLSDDAQLGLRIHTFDGDTPGEIRRAVRESGDIVITNPDMLHQGILPHHTKWAQFFESLRYVVIDELHGYRGVFGSHVANVLRRLERICRFYGVSPIYIFCSATIANPGELASALIGRTVRVIERSGAPRGEQHLLLWNPPVVNEALGLRAPARRETTTLAANAVNAGCKTIVFGRSRTSVEVLTKYLKDRFDRDPRKPTRVKAYRGGYLPGERRAVEKALRDDEIDCVVSTSALELGVDIGGLDVSILNGYPGSVAGTWQRLGRAGRRQRPSLGILVASSAPLDQFIIRHPEFFEGASPEHARIDPNQLLILLDHVRAAAFELPFQDGENFGDQPTTQFLSYLQDQGVLHHESGQWHWVEDSYPANAISLRSVSEGNFLVIDISDGGERAIGEVDYSGAPLTIYEGAIYLMQAQPWQVERLDWDGRKAFVTPTRADYYTDAIDYTRLKILERFDQQLIGEGECAHGEVHVVRRVPGYKKIRYYTHENVGYGHVNLPDQEMHTTALWWRIDAPALERLFPSRWRALEALLGAAHALHHVAALLGMCDLGDLGRSVGDAEGTWSGTSAGRDEEMARDADGEPTNIDTIERHFEPTVFLYDNYPGGIGLTEPLFDKNAQLLRGAFVLVRDCECASGCPSCIGPVLNDSSPKDADSRSAKQGALDVLARLYLEDVPIQTTPAEEANRPAIGPSNQISAHPARGNAAVSGSVPPLNAPLANER
ncbi:MAG: DEAD/DEAH box helicase domain-containing protein [Gammaproteobacteria bacterium]|jgi:DEAD/DEAH box helicase domain-containing protein